MLASCIPVLHLSKLRLTLVTLLSKLQALFRSHLFSHSSSFSVPRSSLGWRSAFGQMIFRWWISRVSDRTSFSFCHLCFLLFVFTPDLIFSRSFFGNKKRDPSGSVSHCFGIDSSEFQECALNTYCTFNSINECWFFCLSLSLTLYAYQVVWSLGTERASSLTACPRTAFQKPSRKKQFSPPLPSPPSPHNLGCDFKQGGFYTRPFTLQSRASLWGFGTRLHY